MAEPRSAARPEAEADVTECPSCTAEVLDIDVRCSQCGHRLTSTGAQRMLGSVVLAQYEIVDIIGQGGMAVVYRARHKMTEQEVALKILPPELAAHAQVKSRFLDEAKALAQLDHPNIVHLYNFGQENGCFVLAMQFVQGATWERMILESGKQPWQVAARICLDVIKALEYAHGRGIVHRDMKPSNVLVREADGTATVMDFGIAKMTTSSKLTATGQTMGTVRYMSPEQVRGLSVDHRTDIYSLGATLYEAVCGDTPFDGETHFEIMTKHLNEPPPPPSAIGIEVPPAFERAMMRALAKRPEDRFQSAADFRAELERALEADGMGEAETLRMTRDVISRLPKKSTSSPTKLSGIAAKLEPTADEEARGETGAQAASRRGPWLWIGLAIAVLAGSAVVFFVMTREPTSKGNAAKPQPRPSVVEPFAVPGMTWAVDERFESDRLRVMATAAEDAGAVRAAVLDVDKNFKAYLEQKGWNKESVRPQMAVELVPPETLCMEAVYREGNDLSEGALGECRAADYWWRPSDKTLLVVAAEPRRSKGLRMGVAAAICLHNDDLLNFCDNDLLAEFSER
jgi:serine/threonine protein kinase